MPDGTADAAPTSDDEAAGAAAAPGRRSGLPLGIAFVAGVIAVVLIGQGLDDGPRHADVDTVYDGSSIEAYEPANPYAISDPAALADAELALARSGGSCDDLELWYEANPYDSNGAIARHFYAACRTTPPPVRNGELAMSDVTGYLPPAAPTTTPPPSQPCPTQDDVTVEVAIVDLRPTDDGLDGWQFGISTTVTSRAAIRVRVTGGIQIDSSAGSWLDYGSYGILLEPGQSETTIDPYHLTYDGQPATAYPVALAPGDPAIEVNFGTPCI